MIKSFFFWKNFKFIQIKKNLFTEKSASFSIHQTYNSATESRDHLFFECLYSREVWYGTIGDLAGNRSLHRWSQIIQFLANGLHERNLTFLLRYSFQVVLYAVWHERNVRRVGETSQPAACLIARLDKLVRNRITSLRRKNGRKYEKTMEVWFGRR